MKELKKLKKKLAKLSVAYIKTHEGHSNRNERLVLEEIKSIRAEIEFHEVFEKSPETRGRFIILKGGLQSAYDTACNTESFESEVERVSHIICGAYSKKEDALDSLTHNESAYLCRLVVKDQKGICPESEKFKLSQTARRKIDSHIKKLCD